MKSSEFLTNMKSIPDETSREYDDFWENERYKAEYGLTVDGVYIHGWLYWHTQLWDILIDEEDKINHIVKRRKEKAQFRDNEWIIADGIHEAERDRKGMLLFGSRRLGKSEFIASYVARKAVLYEGSENAVTGGNWDDIDICTSKITLGLNNLPEYFKFGRLADNPRKMIELGWKAKRGGERIPWSKIIMRNFDNGLNTEGAAGITATSFIIDEVGKFPFAQCFQGAKPAFTSPFGWRCSPILTGTSGDIVASSDAERYFLNPDAFNFILRHLKDEGNKKVSIYISGLYRMEGKVNTTFANFVKTEHGILVPEDSELHTIPFQVKDDAKANAVIDKERAEAALDPDPTALLKSIMYYPRNTKELFLRDDGNNFPIEAINEMIDYLLANPQLQGSPAKLYLDVNGQVRISYNVDTRPLIDYPIKKESDKKSCIVIYEPPMDNAPRYLYIAGCDPYNQTDSAWSNSIGSFYIYKRVYDPIDGTFQRRIVAQYNGRPGDIKDFYLNCEMLMELYGAICLPENEAAGFLQHFDNKNKGYLIADGYDFLKEIAPKTSIPSSRSKGLPATKAVQRYYKELVYRYCMEKIQIGKNTDGSPIIKLGVYRIPDIGLLRELAAYNDEGNFDRYVAFGHTLAHEVWADKIYPFIEHIKKPEEPIQKGPKIVTVNSPFNLGPTNPFGFTKTGTNNPFLVRK